LLSEQATTNARTKAPAEVALRRLKDAEIPVKRRIEIPGWEVTYKTIIHPKLNRT
jgi:hypothetical protein